MHNYLSREQYYCNLNLGDIMILKNIFRNFTNNNGMNLEDYQLIEDEEKLIKDLKMI